MILAGCCGGMLAVVIGRAAPLRVENNVVVIWVPLHVMLLRGLRDGCHRQRRRHLHTRLLVVADPEYCTCFIACFAWTNFHVSFAIQL